MGLYGFAIPEEYGGIGLSMTQEVELVFELGYTTPALRSLSPTAPFRSTAVPATRRPVVPHSRGHQPDPADHHRPRRPWRRGPRLAAGWRYRRGMARTTLRLASCRGFTVDDLRIEERSQAWSVPDVVSEHQLVFVRRGAFRLRLVAYVRPTDVPQRIAHRPTARDACTVIGFDDGLAAELLPAGSSGRPVATGAAVDLAHRMLLARARQGADEFEITERVLTLADQLFVIGDIERGGSWAHRRLADAARERLTTDPAGPTFGTLAAELGVSREHLARVFRSMTGTSLTTFRTRVRVRAALEAIDAGQANLADLAAELGFADQAHLTRTLRAELGRPPSHLRAVLRGA
jgi:AraC-like DNA-binding protein